MAAKTNIAMERLAELLDAYGADRARWPEAERAGAWALIEADEAARTLYDEARALDALMGRASVVEPSPELKARVLADARKPRETWIQALWPFGAAWKPASALAAAIILGVIAGVVLPSPFSGASVPLDNDIGELALNSVFGQEGDQ